MATRLAAACKPETAMDRAEFIAFSPRLHSAQTREESQVSFLYQYVTGILLYFE
jgi:hypothetical protein